MYSNNFIKMYFNILSRGMMLQMHRKKFENVNGKYFLLQKVYIKDYNEYK